MGRHDICHIEWHSKDLEKTAKFFQELFDWKVEPWGEDYSMFETPSGQAGGFLKMEKIVSGQSPIIYIQVEEIEPYLRRVRELEGEVIQGKTEIPHMGWFAHLSDPDGNLVGIYQPLKS